MREVYIFRQIWSQLCVTHRHNSEIQNALISKRSVLLSCKICKQIQIYGLLQYRSKVSYHLSSRETRDERWDSRLASLAAMYASWNSC